MYMEHFGLVWTYIHFGNVDEVAEISCYIVASKFENQNCTVVLKYNFATVTMTNKKYC